MSLFASFCSSGCVSRLGAFKIKLLLEVSTPRSSVPRLDCFVYVFAVLSHCNVHPVVLLFTVLCGFFADAVVLYIDDECIDPLSRYLT